MRINTTYTNINRVSNTKRRLATSQTPFEVFMDEEDTDVDNNSDISSYSSISDVDALLALQNDDHKVNSKQQQRMAYEHVNDMLDNLEQLHRDIVNNKVNPSNISSLRKNLEIAKSMQVNQNRLKNIFDEVQTRVAVELAKLEQVNVNQE